MEQEIIETLGPRDEIQEKILKKTDEQLRYILSSINEDIYLEACAI